MRSRSLAANALEILRPVLAAVVVTAVLLVVLTPSLRFSAAPDPNVVHLYSSVPIHDYSSIVHGIQMAVDEAGGKAGNLTVDYVPLTDDKQQPDGSYHWDADVELANARQAAADPQAMAYIGTYNSGAAKISIPVLNRVHLAMVSPGNTYPGLTKPNTGTAGEPWIYYPLGIRSYFRVVPADDLQGTAAAAFAAKQLGVHSVYVLDDTELYGHGIAVIFAQAAASLGVTVAGGPEGIDVRATSYTDLAQKIVATHPDLVYFGGVTENHPALVLRDLRAAGYTGGFMGADGIENNDFIQQAGADAAGGSGAYATLIGLPANQLAGPGADWYQQYKAKYPSDNNEDFAPFGYEAAKVALHAIAQGGTDREAVRAAMATTKSADLPPPHILGEWQFDANGDTSLVNISVLKMGSAWDYQGGMIYDAAAQTWSFQAK